MLEKWVMAKISADEDVDFSTYKPDCKPGKVGSFKSWASDSCILPSSFVHDLLIDPKLQTKLRQHGLRLTHADLDGLLDLSQLDLEPQIWIDYSFVDGTVDISNSHLHRVFSLEGTSVAGKLFAERMVSDSTILLNHEAWISDKVDFNSSTVHGDIDMFKSTVDDDVLGGNLHVDGDLDISDVDENGNAFIYGNVVLDEAVIGGSLILSHQAIFRNRGQDHETKGGNLQLEDVTVGHALYARALAVAGNIDLIGTRVNGNAYFDGIEVEGNFSASELNVGLGMYGRNSRIGGELDLSDAHLSLGLLLGRAKLSQINLNDADVEELLLDDVKWTCPQTTPKAPETLPALSAGTAPHGTHAAPAPAAPPPAPAVNQPEDKKPAEAHQWPLGDSAWRTFKCNGLSTPDALPLLRLRNARIAALPAHAMSWPVALDIRGLHYDRLGGYLSKVEMGHRTETSLKQWLDWLARDQPFNSQPYTQLASVLEGEGHKDTAEAILFAARDEEREEAWNTLRERVGQLLRPAGSNAAAPGHAGALKGATLAGALGRLLFLMVGLSIGYGIGSYSFYALIPLAVLTAIGTITLYFSPRLRRYPIRSPANDGTYRFFRSLCVGLAWRVGASFQKILPLIEFYKPFKEFIDNPAPEHETGLDGKPLPGLAPRNLARWQVFVFSALSLIGWILGGFVAAAIGGLTQKG